MFYTIDIILFILFCILLFINSTAQVARYLILITSLSLTYTMKPSYIQIIKYKFTLDQSTVQLCISFDKYTFSIGIGDIKPWVLALAKETADASNSYQQRLFLYIFLFAAILTIITNNDISIVCLTPLVCSTANSGNIDSTPFIFMVLITGNPANLIASEAATLTYIGYLKYMIIPTIITGIILHIESYNVYKKLQKRFQVKMQIETWKDYFSCLWSYVIKNANNAYSNGDKNNNNDSNDKSLPIDELNLITYN